MSDRLRGAARLLFVLALALVVVLHLTSDLDPITSRLSEYAAEPQGWAMTVAFLASGAGLALLGWFVLAQGTGRWNTAAGVALGISGVGMVLSGVFPTDPYSDTLVEVVHSQASGVATLTLIGAALVLAFMPDPPLRSSKVLAISGALLAVASFLLHETSLSGLSQRVLWLALMAWALIASTMEPGSDRQV